MIPQHGEHRKREVFLRSPIPTKNKRLSSYNKGKTGHPVHQEQKVREERNFMEIEATGADRNLLLELKGELDHHGALPRKLVLDLTGVTFMDSSGIALILRAQQRMALLDGSLLVRNVPQQARRVLDAAGIGRLVTIR